MDDLRGKLQAALKEAMVNKDNLRRDTIRFVMSAIKQVEVDTRQELTADDVMTVLLKEIKKRRETIVDAEKAGRAELAHEAAAELNILEEFTPKQLSNDELLSIAEDAISKTSATSTQDMGRVMSEIMPQVKGRADGRHVQEIVRELLKP
ncbi:MAG: GatB/YqeY domain-containing protein [Burkholderiales bacterium]|nr:GatB/YqeY domain-containing protein [Anaerolineae bacterium]